MTDAYVISVPQRANSAARVFKGLNHIPYIDRVVMLPDHERRGPWWNTARALTYIATEGRGGLIVQDDVKIRGKALEAHLEALVGHLGTYGLISLFAPPQIKYDRLNEQGYHGEVSRNFFWAQMYLVSAKFAQDVLECDAMLDQSKVTIHDEIRFRYAAQVVGTKMVTLASSFCEHDLDVKSVMGTPPKIGSVVRNTRNLATEAGDFTTLRLKEGPLTDKDIQEYSA